ncbi:flagellar export protein FliJ [Desulfopila sp. IMCC35008]|uniref:flagellar export protein FliJ n=1 Tax=Desulfopila sp. IMCC35008 TaxID=2653858 RepID=UPI0013D1CFE3|nr:flagellar export protein FliJ [Desulfopila sp. IMCC35008]
MTATKPFTLDTVLHYRERLETLAQEALSVARRAEDKVKEELKKKHQAYGFLASHITTIQEQGVAINELISQEEHLAFIKNEISELEQVLAEKKKQVQKSHTLLVEKSKQRQVMEKLKERQNVAWKQHLDKKEAAMLDEMAIVFHDRK